MAGKVFQIWLGLCFSIVTIVLLGLEVAFNVYAVHLKKAFNFTQTEVELVSVSGLAGMGASLAEPYITQKFGYKIGYFVIWLTTSGSALLLYIAILYREIFKYWPQVICLIQFLMNASQSAGFMRLISISVHNLPERHVGKIVGLSHSAVAAAKLFYGAMLQVFFEDDLKHFVLFVAIIYAVFVGACSVLHVPQDHVTDRESRETSMAPDESNRKLFQNSSDSSRTFSDSNKTSSADRCDYPRDNPTSTSNISRSSRKLEKITDKSSNCSLEENHVGTMFKSVGFHRIFWPSVVIYSVMFTYMNNITSIAYSLGAEQPMHMVYVLSVTVVIGRSVSGWLFDQFHSSSWCVFLLLMTSALSVIVGLTLLVVTTDHISILYLVSFLLGIGVSVGITIPVSLLTVRFGSSGVPYIIGCYYCLIAVFCLIFQFGIGILYDRTLSADGFCYGPRCFFLSSLMLIALMTLCSCVYVVDFVTNMAIQ